MWYSNIVLTMLHVALLLLLPLPITPLNKHSRITHPFYHITCLVEHDYLLYFFHIQYIWHKIRTFVFARQNEDEKIFP